MGITIVQKSDLSVRKKNPKIALVLAGGAITGGAFKLGGLKALDDFLVNRKTTEFDTYIGLSAGAILAAPLAAGITPAETLQSLAGQSARFSGLGLREVYTPAIWDFVASPARFAYDLVRFLPETVSDMLRQAPAISRQLNATLEQAWQNPTVDRLEQILSVLTEGFARQRDFPSPLDYLPSGFFDNSNIERYLRHNMEANRIPNDFRALYRSTRKELYIAAMNLDTAERVIFGYDEDTSATVSQAVQASAALPGFYKPARINGIDYVDGGVRRTANIDVAIEHGADLIICYNPFRPFSNRVHRTLKNGRYTVEGRMLAETGVLTVMNQVFRTLMHSRLQYGLRQYQDDPTFRGDIVIIEPKETDRHFFRLGPMSYWSRMQAGQYGYVSVTESIQQNYDLIKQILESYGISMTRKNVQEGVERIRDDGDEKSSEVLMRDVPRRDLSVA